MGQRKKSDLPHTGRMLQLLSYEGLVASWAIYNIDVVRRMLILVTLGAKGLMSYQKALKESSF